MADKRSPLSEYEEIIEPSRHCHIIDRNGDKIFYGKFGDRPDYLDNLKVIGLSIEKSTRGRYLRIVVDIYWNTF